MSIDNDVSMDRMGGRIKNGDDSKENIMQMLRGGREVNNITEVQLFKDDFRVIHLALMECQTSWRNMIDSGELPDVPNMDMGRAQHILVRFSEVKDKIQTILDGEPLKVDGESVRKILDIIKENGT